MYVLVSVCVHMCMFVCRLDIWNLVLLSVRVVAHMCVFVCDMFVHVVLQMFMIRMCVCVCEFVCTCACLCCYLQ